MDSKNRGNLGGHPLIVLITVSAALIAIIVFITGRDSLPELLNSQFGATATLSNTENSSASLAPTSDMSSVQISETDGMLLVHVPAGEFLMGAGSYETEAGSDEKPQHLVYLDAFWIDKTEVTNGMYKLCVQAKSCMLPNTNSATRASHYNNDQYAEFPVVYVSWDNAKQYCEWANRRLPTEAEWEKAARGPAGQKYPWGNIMLDTPAANINTSNIGDTAQVGSYPIGASPYGALDMAGNVWEWTNDYYDKGYFSISPSQNPVGPLQGDEEKRHVLKGGSWKWGTESIYTAHRIGYPPGYRFDDFGFRCAVDTLP